LDLSQLTVSKLTPFKFTCLTSFTFAGDSTSLQQNGLLLVRLGFVLNDLKWCTLKDVGNLNP